MNNHLTRQQKEEFVENGFLHIPSAMPLDTVLAALRAINHSIGEVGKTGAVPSGTGWTPTAMNFAVRRFSPMSSIKSPSCLSEDLLGPGNVQSVEEVQIAARFPLAPRVEAPPIEGHVDAAGTGTNGAPKGSYLRNFTVIAVVYPVDVPAPPTVAISRCGPSPTSNPAISFGVWDTKC